MAYPHTLELSIEDMGQIRDEGRFDLFAQMAPGLIEKRRVQDPKADAYESLWRQAMVSALEDPLFTEESELNALVRSSVLSQNNIPAMEVAARLWIGVATAMPEGPQKTTILNTLDSLYRIDNALSTGPDNLSAYPINAKVTLSSRAPVEYAQGVMDALMLREPQVTQQWCESRAQKLQTGHLLNLTPFSLLMGLMDAHSQYKLKNLKPHEKSYYRMQTQMAIRRNTLALHEMLAEAFADVDLDALWAAKQGASLATVPSWKRFNDLVKHIQQAVSVSILKQGDIPQVMRAFETWIATAHEAVNLGNYSLAKAIYMATAGNITLSNRYGSLLSSQSKTMLDTLSQLFSPSQNAKAYRTHLQNFNGLTIPDVTILSKDVFMGKEADITQVENLNVQKTTLQAAQTAILLEKPRVNAGIKVAISARFTPGLTDKELDAMITHTKDDIAAIKTSPVTDKAARRWLYTTEDSPTLDDTSAQQLVEYRPTYTPAHTVLANAIQQAISGNSAHLSSVLLKLQGVKHKPALYQAAEAVQAFLGALQTDSQNCHFILQDILAHDVNDAVANMLREAAVDNKDLAEAIDAFNALYAQTQTAPKARNPKTDVIEENTANIRIMKALFAEVKAAADNPKALRQILNLQLIEHPQRIAIVMAQLPADINPKVEPMYQALQQMHALVDKIAAGFKRQAFTKAAVLPQLLEAHPGKQQLAVLKAVRYMLQNKDTSPEMRAKMNGELLEFMSQRLTGAAAGKSILPLIRDCRQWRSVMPKALDIAVNNAIHSQPKFARKLAHGYLMSLMMVKNPSEGHLHAFKRQMATYKPLLNPKTLIQFADRLNHGSQFISAIRKVIPDKRMAHLTRVSSGLGRERSGSLSQVANPVATMSLEAIAKNLPTLRQSVSPMHLQMRVRQQYAERASGNFIKRIITRIRFRHLMRAVEALPTIEPATKTHPLKTFEQALMGQGTGDLKNGADDFIRSGTIAKTFQSKSPEALTALKQVALRAKTHPGLSEAQQTHFESIAEHCERFLQLLRPKSEVTVNQTATVEAITKDCETSAASPDADPEADPEAPVPTAQAMVY